LTNHAIHQWFFQRLKEETVSNEPKVNAAVLLGRTIVKDRLIREDDLEQVAEEMNELEHRLEYLKMKNRGHQIK
jgi:hypothetical protein